MQKSLFSLFLILVAILSMLGCGSSSSNSELRSIDEYVNVIKVYFDQRYHFKNEESKKLGLTLKMWDPTDTVFKWGTNLFDKNGTSKSTLFLSIKSKFEPIIEERFLKNSQVDIIADKLTNIYEMTEYTVSSLGETKEFEGEEDEYHALNIKLKYPNYKKINEQVRDNVKKELGISSNAVDLISIIKAPFTTFSDEKTTKTKEEIGEIILNNYNKILDNKDNIPFQVIEEKIYIKKYEKDTSGKTYYVISNNQDRGLSMNLLANFDILNEVAEPIHTASTGFKHSFHVFSDVDVELKDIVIDMGEKGKFPGFELNGEIIKDIDIAIYNVQENISSNLRDSIHIKDNINKNVTVSYIIKNNSSVKKDIDLYQLFLDKLYDNYNEVMYYICRNGTNDTVTDNAKYLMENEKQDYYSYNAKFNGNILSLEPKEILIIPVKYSKEVNMYNGNLVQKLPEFPYHIIKDSKTYLSENIKDTISYGNSVLNVSISPTSTFTETAVEESKQALIKYHKAITDKNYQEAYDMLSPKQKKKIGDYDSFVKRYSGTIVSAINSLKMDERASDRKFIHSENNKCYFEYQLLIKDTSAQQFHLESGIVHMFKANGRWYISSI